MPAKLLLLETTAYVELVSPMIRKLQVILPELMVVTLWYFAETVNGLNIYVILFSNLMQNFFIKSIVFLFN